MQSNVIVNITYYYIVSNSYCEIILLKLPQNIKLKHPNKPFKYFSQTFIFFRVVPGGFGGLDVTIYNNINSVYKLFKNNNKYYIQLDLIYIFVKPFF